MREGARPGMTGQAQCVFRRRATNQPTKGKTMTDLESRVQDLEAINRQMTARIKKLSDDLDELRSLCKTLAKKTPNNSAPPAAKTFGPPKERARQTLIAPHMDGEHVIPGDLDKKTVKAAEMRKAGLWSNRNQAIVQLCDQVECVAGHHHKVMSKSDAASFNASRVAAELVTLDKAEVAEQLTSMFSTISGDHMVPKDGEYSFRLPSGRGIGYVRASWWAFRDRAGEVPRFIIRECGSGDCVNPKHLKVDR